MIVVRCPACAMTPSLRTRSQMISAEPVGYPNPGIICGTPGCTTPGLAWLRGVDAVRYRSGQQSYFRLSNSNAAKVLVKSP